MAEKRRAYVQHWEGAGHRTGCLLDTAAGGAIPEALQGRLQTAPSLRGAGQEAGEETQRG